MLFQSILTRLKQLHSRINGSTIEYDLSSYYPVLMQINAFASELKAASDTDLQALSRELMGKARDNHSLDTLLPRAFALVREAIQRTLQLHPFDEQIIAGIALHQGHIAEMKTGEGKTLCAVFAAYLNSLTGKGVHVFTCNDYLAKRDALWMGPVYAFLGVRTGFVQEGMSIAERQHAYAADITYLSARESGFDFLRDTICREPAQQVHRDFNYAIIDEADSILIDEARIPLVIAEAADFQETDKDPLDVTELARLAGQLQEKKDFEFDAYARNIFLTDHGTRRIEEALKSGNLYDEKNNELVAKVNHALHAQFLLHRDHDYIVRNGQVELVDEFTGRIADKRQWPDGLHAAVVAKEKLTAQLKGRILNSISLQHYIQYYPKICGMTATAQISEEEFRVFYNLPVVVIPPHKPCIRIDHPDVLFTTKEAKQRAVINEIVAVHATQRPILAGTSSIEESATLAQAIRQRGVPCQVLNAKEDEIEAHVIAEAGRPGAVTISTNMAGRGTDIRLGGKDETEKAAVSALSGLYVIGTNKHESSRIDNQLRGRAGRQGDPGSSRYFISLEDDLFVKYRLKELLPSMVRNANAEVIDNPVFRNEITRVQRIIEGQNLEIKITLCRYSFIVEQQRTVISQKRKNAVHHDTIARFFRKNSADHYQRLIDGAGEERVIEAGKSILTSQIDKLWSNYLAAVNDIREGIHLRRYGGQNPLFEFNKSVVGLFESLQHDMDEDSIRMFNGISLTANGLYSENSLLKAPSATWTYLINDNPFENAFMNHAIDPIGLSFGAILAWPLMLLYPLLKKIKARK